MNLNWLPALRSINLALLVWMAFALECDYELHVDAHWFQGNVECQQRWNSSSGTLKGNPLYNFGVQVPFQANLSPAFAFSKYIESDKKVVFQILVQGLLIYFLFLGILKNLSFSPLVSEALSLFASFLVWIPKLTDNALTAQITLGLYWQEIAIHNLIALLLLQHLLISKSNGIKIVIFFMLGSTLLYSVLLFPMFAPHLFLTHLCGASAIFFYAEKQNKKNLLIFYSIIAALFISFKIPKFLFYLFTYTREGFFPAESELYRSDCLKNPFWLIRRTSIFLYPGVGNIIATIIAVVSLCFPLICLKANTKAMPLAIYLLGAWAAGFLYNIKWLTFGGPPSAGFYFELVNAPVFSLVFIISIYLIYSKFSRSKNFKILGAALLFVSYLFFCHILIKVQKQSHFAKWPPSESNWIQTIREHSQIGRDGAFRGKSLVLLNSKSLERSGWGPFYDICANKIRKKIGNDLTLDLMYADVPFFNEYGHFISPPMLSLLCASFYDPKDYVERAARSPRVFNKKMAELLGVTTVVTDSPLLEEKLLIREDFDGHEVFLYKTTEANLGQFSPVDWKIYSNLGDFVEKVKSGRIDFKKTALVEASIEGELTAAKLKVLRFEKGPSIRIEAESAGQSLLVLPFDFSYCIQYGGKGNPLIVPVNLSCTGILFKGKIEGWLRFRFSPFANLEQRKRDIQRGEALGISTTAPGLLFTEP